MVVVADPGLIPGNGAGWLDASDQAGRGERAEHVVHGLLRDLAEIAASDAENLIGVGVRVLVDRGQHRDPRPGHPQRGAPQQVLDFRLGRDGQRGGHQLSMSTFSGISQEQRCESPQDGRRQL